ncbi:MAG: protein-L-isoaspartate O-methyltransferase [Pseudomonadota bacterium]
MTEMNFEIARLNMLEQQIRPWEVLDQKSLDLLQQIPREEFVPENFRNVAFSDTELPLAHHQFMLEPKIEGRIIQSLQITSTDKVLEIGTGSGYLTALLASSANNVQSIDIFEDFINSAKNKLKSLEINNVTFENVDINNFDLSGKQFDIIVMSAAVTEVDLQLKRALSMNGRLFIVCGEAPVMFAKLFTRVGEEQWIEEILFETIIPVMENAKDKRDFIF